MSKTSKILLPIGVIILGIISAGILIILKREVVAVEIEIPPPPVKVLQLQKETYQFRVESQGAVKPKREIALSAEVDGIVVELPSFFEDGGFFQKGDVLLEVERRDYELRLIRAEAQVRNAQVLMAREEAERDVARKEWEELGRGVASALTLREPQIKEAMALLASAQADFEMAKLDLERTRIRAKFNGRVKEKSVDIGQFIKRGEPIARLYSIDYAEIRLPIPVDDLKYLGIGVDYSPADESKDQLTVELSARIAGETGNWIGHIDRVESEIDDRSRMIPLVASVKDPFDREDSYHQQPLPMGLFVKASILGLDVPDVLRIPRTSLREGHQVLIVNDEDKIEIRDVEVLRAGRTDAFLIGGVEEGEKLIISPMETPTRGLTVHITDTN